MSVIYILFGSSKTIFYLNFIILCFSDFILLPGFIDFVAGDVVSFHLMSIPIK
jgi:hypothetical protein